MTPPELDLLLSITLVLGVLYVNLPASRYRDKLYASIKRSIERRANEFEPAARDEMLKSDGDFSEKYHFVSQWYGELPSGYQPSFSCDELFCGGAKDKSLGREYQWFKCDGDRWACMILAIAVPILHAWINAFAGPTEYGLPSYLSPALGQICVVAHILLGKSMVWTRRKEFDGALEGLVLETQGELLTQRVKSYRSRSIAHGIDTPPEPDFDKPPT